jgi:transcriptional regulator with XRE-family HTH domain
VLTSAVNTATLRSMTRPLAQVLRELREVRGASLRTAARDLGVDPAHLSRLERGEKPVSSDLLKRAARYYKVDHETLTLASGALPDDVVAILRGRPDLIERIRTEYGSK